MRRSLSIPPRRGSTLILVIWAIGVTTLAIVSLQMSAFRQASVGREALGRVRARWAARAGVENCIAYLAWDTQNATRADYAQIVSELESRARGELGKENENSIPSAEYVIQHTGKDGLVDGPADAHAKFNINLVSLDMILKLDLDGMTPEIANGILDWIDADAETREGGAESGYYLQSDFPYEPRNGVIRTIEELELVRDVDSEWLRGEDWNLNGVLDPNENDHDLTPPDDDEDDELDFGWSEFLTAASRDSAFGPSGRPKIDLQLVEDLTDVRERFSMDTAQAQALVDWGKGQGAKLEDLITTPLSQIGQPGGQQQEQQQEGGRRRRNSTGANQRQNQPGGGVNAGARDLTDPQLRKVLAEATIGPAGGLRPGKLNINAAPIELLEALPQVDTVLADRIALYRESLANGYESILDLRTLPGMNDERIVGMAPYIDVRSNVYVITSRGIGRPGRTEVELVVTIDRSTLPIRILDSFER